jgi:OmpA-OmpF porin, OOP family
MNRKQLCALIALSLGGAATAQAQDYDDRWYVNPYIGGYFNDEDRLSDDGTVLFGMGIGKYISSNAAIDVFVDRTQRGANEAGRLLLGTDDSMDSTMYGVAVRFFFGDADWRPYLMGGAGLINHTNGAEEGWDPGFQIGAGIQNSLTDRVAFRGEVGYRYDMDGDSIPGEDNYGDWMINLGVTIALGGAEEVVEEVREEVREEVAATPCSSLDDDKDGVNNCDDKCPNTAAGQIVGPDGCTQDVVIDLRGVEFKFDRPSTGETDIAPTLKEPSSEGIAILDQAVDVLNRYPQVRVEVAGHTDAIGTDEYNQGLSERRARIVYDYLTAKGVDAGRLAGPVGYGEARPIDTNDTKEGRQRNRRTELDVQ